MIFVIHIKVEEASKVSEGLTIFNRRHDFRVDKKALAGIEVRKLKTF